MLLGRGIFQLGGAIAEWNQSDKLMSTQTGKSGFGWSVDVSYAYDTLVVGVPTEPLGTASGRTYVYTRSGLSWSLQQLLTASDAGTADWFGYDVCFSNDSLICGAPRWDGTYTDDGAAYVFTRSGGTWTEQQKLTAGDPTTGVSEFGQSVSIDGDTCIIGSPTKDGTYTNDGAAYVFTRSGGTWTQQQKLLPTTPDQSAHFGHSVSIDGNTCIVGAPYDDNGGTAPVSRGHAYVFTRSGSTWTQRQKLAPSDPAISDYFGWSVKVKGDVCVVGAVTKDGSGTNRGAVYVFTRSGSTWTQQQKLTPSDTANNDLFGASVDYNGDYIVVGSPQGPYNTLGPPGVGNGKSYVFALSGGTWVEQQKLVASDGATDDGFGCYVACDTNIVVCGAYSNDEAGSNAGAVYTFTP